MQLSYRTRRKVLERVTQQHIVSMYIVVINNHSKLSQLLAMITNDNIHLLTIPALTMPDEIFFNAFKTSTNSLGVLSNAL